MDLDDTVRAPPPCGRRHLAGEVRDPHSREEIGRFPGNHLARPQLRRRGRGGRLFRCARFHDAANCSRGPAPPPTGCRPPLGIGRGHRRFFPGTGNLRWERVAGDAPPATWYGSSRASAVKVGIREADPDPELRPFAGRRAASSEFCRNAIRFQENSQSFMRSEAFRRHKFCGDKNSRHETFGSLVNHRFRPCFRPLTPARRSAYHPCR
jgi:hypothetical protein